MNGVSLEGQGPRVVPHGAPPAEGWLVVASKDGWLRSLTPEVFPFCGSRDEALQRARVHAARDRDFARKFHGCFLYAVRIDDAVPVDAHAPVPRQWR